MTTLSRKGKEKVVPDIEMAAGQDQATESYKEFNDRMLAARMKAHNFTRDYITESADDFEVNLELAFSPYILPKPIPRVNVSANSRRLSEIAETVPPDLRRLSVTSTVPGERDWQQQPGSLESQPMQSSNDPLVPHDSQEIVPGGQQWEDVADPSSQLQYANARALLTKKEFGRLFQTLDPDSMDEIWKLTTDLTANNLPLMIPYQEKIKKVLTLWSPGTMFLDKQKRTYHVYHPSVMETRKNTWFLVGFDKENTSNLMDEHWVSLPTIDYLPVEQNDRGKSQRRIIAGSAGLLVVDAGDQGPRLMVKPKGGTSMVVNEKFWKHKMHPHPQSIVYVTNPLTQEYRILPPVAGRLLKGKAARLVWRNTERTSYMLILVGYDDRVHEREGSQKRKRQSEDQVSLFVYCSEKELYTHADWICGCPNARAREGDSGLGVIGYGVYVGGYFSRKKGAERCPCVYYFNVSAKDKCSDQTPFTVPELPAGISLLAPRVLQVGPERLFAVTRQSESLGAVFLTEILLTEKGRCHGFRLITTSPDNVTNEIFRKAECESLCEVSACSGIIAIRGGGKSNLVALYNVERNKWSITQFPQQTGIKNAYYRMMEAAYEPSFLARP